MSRTKGASEDHCEATLQEIADHFGKTREWARQEINNALNKIRASGELTVFRDLLTTRVERTSP
jgi:DNA-directed RNA polymerase sigma subunit (sigma70/sigma32)